MLALFMIFIFFTTAKLITQTSLTKKETEDMLQSEVLFY